MSPRNRWMTGLPLLLAAAAGLWYARTLEAQPRTKEPPRVYQYVGLDRTIARIDAATGKIEVLSKRNETAASLLMPDPRPWYWREVRVQEEPSRDARPETKPEEVDEGA